jgi:hygromycin-B 7''-O-kinase
MSSPARPDLPPIASLAELEALAADPPRWAPHVASLAAELGLADLPLHSLGGGNLVVAIGDHHVLKLTPPRFAREVEAEAAAFAVLGDRRWPGALRAPELLGRGRSGTWPWVLITRLPGATLASSRAGLTRANLATIARDLGAWLNELHRPPHTSATALAGSWSRLVDAKDDAITRQASWGVPRALCEDMRALLQRVDLACAAPTLLHSDLHDDNVLVERRESGLIATGVIDFGDAMEGDPLFDLVTPVALVARGDGAAVRALFEGAGRGADLDDRREIDRFMAMSIIHRWNDLTRVKAWAPDALGSMDALERALLGDRSAAR